MAEPAPDLNAVYSRLITHADRLFETLEDLGAAGGFDALASVMKATSVARAAQSLESVRQAIDGQLAKGKRPKGGGLNRRPGAGPGAGGGTREQEEGP